MYLRYIAVEFLHDLRVRKTRAMLAILGIAWGTFSLVFLLALSKGLYITARDLLHGTGNNIVIVLPSTTTRPFDGMPAGRIINIPPEDAMDLKAFLPQVSRVSPEIVYGKKAVVYGDGRLLATVAGVGVDYGVMRTLTAIRGGRFLNERDVGESRRVAFIGDKLKEELIGTRDAVGEWVKLDGIMFRIIGTLKKKIQGSHYSGGKDEGKVYVPYTAGISVWGERNNDTVCLIQPESLNSSGAMIQALYRHLGRTRRFDPQDTAALRIWDLAQMDRLLSWLYMGLQLILALGGGITLVAGGIGVANIMFLIVQERTREIGIRIAVGAQRWHVVLHFTMEAVLMVLIGGGGGFLLATGLIGGIRALPLPDWFEPPEISLGGSLVAVAVLAVVGFASGLFPAKAATKTAPVQALGQAK